MRLCAHVFRLNAYNFAGENICNIEEWQCAVIKRLAILLKYSLKLDVACRPSPGLLIRRVDPSARALTSVSHQEGRPRSDDSLDGEGRQTDGVQASAHNRLNVFCRKCNVVQSLVMGIHAQTCSIVEQLSPQLSSS